MLAIIESNEFINSVFPVYGGINIIVIFGDPFKVVFIEATSRSHLKK
jgi:hypothetical protein